MGRPVTWIRSFFRRHPRGQSLVEFTILLPVLLMMLSGLIEFGFLLNTYLDIIDAAREAARFSANDDPTTGVPTDPYLPPTQVNFWHRAWGNARSSLYTASDARINWTPTNPVDCSVVEGDVVASAFGVLGTSVDKRFPLGYGDNGASNCGNYFSKLTSAQVNSLLSGASIPNQGFVVVEIFYEYHMVLGLPWIGAFLPDPIVLYAYTIMPNTYVEPTPTP
jgi:hypothetical protein